ncbi:hypothetical protein ACMU_10345 [Actibacterium mucosum KCTC 23349]|uniref:Antitoxin SocA-like Panacea domain-containing protein n=1 Tax=Actibacterium mucosum KCTC 23349 TaxID=1454373 RepID=A0A037ZI70_9RHOB|nr:type II toxin-antitoxin system antitoxin SocA domain-containing protein [Actibacterium mucosum]KAJ56145.1 hypothetical protein ACMU_10345 [Actibacterium mucosum KCTC 23349]
MEYDARLIANIVLDEAESQGHPLSNLALQKVMFFCHAWHLVDTGKPLIKHEFEAWQHGPVLQFIYRQFKESESRPIRTRAKKLNPLNGRHEVAQGEIDSSTRARIRKVVGFYGRLEPWDLVDLSHVEGGPWHSVWNNAQRVNPGMKISHNAIREFYSSAMEGRPIQ